MAQTERYIPAFHTNLQTVAERVTTSLEFIRGGWVGKLLEVVQQLVDNNINNIDYHIAVLEPSPSVMVKQLKCYGFTDDQIIYCDTSNCDQSWEFISNIGKNNPLIGVWYQPEFTLTEKSHTEFARALFANCIPNAVVACTIPISPQMSMRNKSTLVGRYSSAISYFSTYVKPYSGDSLPCFQRYGSKSLISEIIGMEGDTSPRRLYAHFVIQVILKVRKVKAFQ